MLRFTAFNSFSCKEFHGPLTRYAKLPVAHAPGMPGTFSPPPRVSDPDMHHGPCVMHVPWCMPGSLTSGFLWSRWRGKRSRHPGACAAPNFAQLVIGPWRSTSSRYLEYYVRVEADRVCDRVSDGTIDLCETIVMKEKWCRLMVLPTNRRLLVSSYVRLRRSLTRWGLNKMPPFQDDIFQIFQIYFLKNEIFSFTIHLWSSQGSNRK